MDTMLSPLAKHKVHGLGAGCGAHEDALQLAAQQAHEGTTMDTARIQLLQQMPIFGAIDDAALQFLLDPVASVSVAQGHHFFREGDPADGMYVLESGRVSIVKEWDGRTLLLRQLEAGDCFGEMALLDLFPRSASVRSEADCRAFVLTPADLYRLYEHDAKTFALIQMNIGREMSRRLRDADDQLFRATVGEKRSAPLTTAYHTL